eukprot:jgi/Mesvir1/20873/Mv07953-RA.1
MHARGAITCVGLTPLTACFASKASRSQPKSGRLLKRQRHNDSAVKIYRVVKSELAHGGASQAGIGRLLALDEFFSSPGPGLSLTADIPESVVYFLQPANDVESPLDTPSQGHGIQLHLRSQFASQAGAAPPIPGIVHVRSRGDVPVATLAEGVTVHVVAGACGDVATRPPLDDFVFFDVKAGASKDFCVPLPASYTAAVYVLQGVGIFGPKGGRVSYENEGHLVMLPGDLSASRLDTSLLQIRTHPCDGLRCIIVAAEGDVLPLRGNSILPSLP